MPIGYPQRASLLRVEMVHQASPRPVRTTLCTSHPRPFGHILGPLGNSFPETWLPGGKETGGGDESTPVCGKGDCSVSDITVMGGGIDLEGHG